MNFREIQQLQNRIDKIRKVKKPPRLRCIVLNPGEKEPDDLICTSQLTLMEKLKWSRDPFALVIQVEEKKGSSRS